MIQADANEIIFRSGQQLALHEAKAQPAYWSGVFAMTLPEHLRGECSHAAASGLPDLPDLALSRATGRL